MIRTQISNYLARFLAIILSVSLVTYLLVPINFASGIGYVTWRSIALSNSSLGVANPTVVTAPSPATTGTSMVVSSSAGYPTPPFFVTIGATATEIVEVTAVNGTTWTLVRGYNGTTALSYSAGNTISGATVAHVQFVPATPATNIQAIVVDFCTDSPLYNSSTCYTPSGMSIGPSGASTIEVTGITGISSSIDNATYTKAYNSSRNDLILSNNTNYLPGTATTIPGTINTTQTSFTVSSSANYPAATTGNPNTYFYIQVGSEDMQVTNVSGTTWTVTRGVLGTGSSLASGTGLSISQPPISFTVWGIMNPTSTGALYARIYTFSTYTSEAASFASSTATAGILSPTTYNAVSSYVIDGGGVALYITNSLTVNAKVQEYLQFCIYIATGTSSTPCSLTGSTVTLGNASGILSLANAYVDSSTAFDVATNASGYAAITFTGSPLANGSNLIENSSLSGTGSTAATAYPSTVGTDQFGLCVNASGTQATGYSSSNLSFPNNTYNGTGSGSGTCPTTVATSAVYSGSSANFGLNIAQAGSVYGDLLATQKPGTGSTGLISFIGNVAASQLAGSYTTSFNFVATGTY